MSLLKLSIITINLNDVSGLSKTICSVVAQKYVNFEYIVVDGGSTDGSLAVLNKYSHKITSWISEPDNGIYNAMNKGISKAKGEYLLFLNSGDILTHEDILNEIDVNLGVFDLIYGNLIVDNGQGLVEHSFPKKLSLKYFLLATIPHPGTFIKRTLFEQVGLYNESFKIVSDWEFFVKAVCIFNCSYNHVDKSISIINTNGISYNPQNTSIIAKEKEAILRIYFSDVVKDYQASLKPDVFWNVRSGFKGISVKMKEILNRFLSVLI